MSIMITADSSCDVTIEALQPVPFKLFPLTIIQNGVEYKDGVNLTPTDIYACVDADGPVPTTSAVNVMDYTLRFGELLKEHDAIIHISIGSGISSCYDHAMIASQDMPNVHIVDSQNISVGSGILVFEARRMILEGVDPATIAEILREMATKVEFYFLINQVTYLRKGGRCSNLAALGANLLNLKPCIVVQKTGTLAMGKKYRGALEKVIPTYVADYLKDRDDILPERCQLVATGCPPHWVEMACAEIEKNCGHKIEEVFRAGCTICSHSGPRALGLAILRK